MCIRVYTYICGKIAFARIGSFISFAKVLLCFSWHGYNQDELASMTCDITTELVIYYHLAGQDSFGK